MDSMTFAQLAADARRKKALAEGVKLPSPPKNGKNKKLPEESQPASSDAAGSTDSPVVQPAKRQKTLPPSGSSSKKVAGTAKDKGKEIAAEESEPEITVRDTGVVHCSDSAFSDLSPKDLRIRWRRALGQLVSGQDLKQLATIPARTRTNELLSLQAEFNIRMQYELTLAVGVEKLEADLKDAQKRVNDLNGKLIVKNDKVMSLTRENKGLRHSLDKMHGKCRFLKEAVLLRERELALKKKIAKEWLETTEGRQHSARLAADAYAQGMRVKELMLQHANEKSENKVDFAALLKAGEEEHDLAVKEVTEEMKELESLGLDEDDEAEKAAWEEALPSELLKKYDVDFEHYDISIPTRPPTPQASPVQAVPLLPSTVPPSPSASAGRRSPSVSAGHRSPAPILQPDVTFSVEDLLGGDE